jgi:hypothetical protein
MTQGDPDEALEQTGTKLRSYVVLSDLSEEAGYALQWAIGERDLLHLDVETTLIQVFRRYGRSRW